MTKTTPTPVADYRFYSVPKAQLFVYGIFLDQYNRDEYLMFNPRYATVKGFVTKGSRIVTAYPSDDHRDALTGLLVDIVDDDRNWTMLDALEMGYDRILVQTTDGTVAYMYAARGTGNRVSVEEE